MSDTKKRRNPKVLSECWRGWSIFVPILLRDKSLLFVSASFSLWKDKLTMYYILHFLNTWNKSEGKFEGVHRYRQWPKKKGLEIKCQKKISSYDTNYHLQLSQMLLIFLETAWVSASSFITSLSLVSLGWKWSSALTKFSSLLSHMRFGQRKLKHYPHLITHTIPNKKE